MVTWHDMWQGATQADDWTCDWAEGGDVSGDVTGQEAVSGFHRTASGGKVVFGHDRAIPYDE